MNNINEIYELIVSGDESLSGSCWEDLNYSYYATPKDVIDDVIKTYMSNEIFGMDDVSITDKKLALAKYFEYVAESLKPDKNIMSSTNDMIISCLKYLPFDVNELDTTITDEYLRYDMLLVTHYGYNFASIKINKDTIIENTQKESEYKYLRMIAQAIEKEYDKKLKTLLSDDCKENEKTIKTAIVIHARISYLLEMMDNGEFLIK